MKIAAISAAALLAMTITASAKNKMEKVDIVRDGIDLQTISVKASTSGYTGIDRTHYTFSVRGYAKAKSGYRILRAWFHTGKLDQAHVLQLPHRDIGSGRNRTVRISRAYKAPVGQIIWDGPSPLQACQANLAKLQQAGFSRQEILGKTFDLKVRAIVGFSAVADREGRDPFPIGPGGGSTWRTKTMSYDVSVACLSRPKRAA